MAYFKKKKYLDLRPKGNSIDAIIAKNRSKRKKKGYSIDKVISKKR